MRMSFVENRWFLKLFSPNTVLEFLNFLAIWELSFLDFFKKIACIVDKRLSHPDPETKAIQALSLTPK